MWLGETLSVIWISNYTGGNCCRYKCLVTFTYVIKLNENCSVSCPSLTFGLQQTEQVRASFSNIMHKLFNGWHNMTLHKVLHKFVIALKRAKLASCSTGENTKQRLHTFPPFSRGSWGRKKTKNELRVITRSLPDLMSQTTARSYKKHISTIPCQSNNKLSFVWPRFAQTTIKAVVARWLRHGFGVRFGCVRKLSRSILEISGSLFLFHFYHDVKDKSFILFI